MEEILSVTGLQKHFEKRGLFRAKEVVRAVDGVSFSVGKGKTLVLAGESGSGKTTIARLILGGIEPDGGQIVFDGFKIGTDKASLDRIRRECQMIHQDPYASIDPRMRIIDIVTEPLEVHGIGDSKKRREIASEALRDVKLDPAEIFDKYPHMLSGGQRQRVVIARSIATKPKLIIADEPVSMLDVSVRVGILELMRELQEKHGISFLYITHDLSTARYVGNSIAIMYLGKIVETGPIEEVLLHPMHPYTMALVESISEPNPDNLNREKKMKINAPLEVNPYEGCRFRPRCPYAIEKCSQEPPLERAGQDRSVACFVRPD
ncbi:MAG TPA: ABC transporter ATP-binding protein [Candidatus Nitrosotalea sp.]|nr:ABC transporter ATP-binding protein [Candidatus Nitrosotalea sp.]